MLTGTLQGLKMALPLALLPGTAMWLFFRSGKLRVIEGKYVERFTRCKACYPCYDGNYQIAALRTEMAQEQGMLVRTKEHFERFTAVPEELLAKIREGQKLRITFQEKMLERNIRKVEVQKGEEFKTVFEC